MSTERVASRIPIGGYRIGVAASKQAPSALETGDRVRVGVEAGIAEVRLVRGAKHNALDQAMFTALSEAVDEVAATAGVRAVLIHGEGPSFCSGLDFPSFMAAGADVGDGFSRRPGEPANRAQRITFGWRALPVPVVAALRGACFGGGLQLALAADIRIAAPDTRLSVMEIRYGLIPDMGLSQTLPGLVRADIARELTYTGRVVEAAEAAAIGLVTRVAEEPLAEARALAREIASKSPDAIRGAKRLLGAMPGAGAEEGLALEAEIQQRLLGSPNQIAAVAASFAGEPAEFEDPA